MDTFPGALRVPGGWAGLGGTYRSRLNFDHKWTCQTCHPYAAKREGERIQKAFFEHEMWVSVVATTDVARAVRKARRSGVSYVALPVGNGDRYVVCTTGPLFEGGGSALVQYQSEFVKDTLMPLRWEGRLRSTRRFLPPDRSYDYWETHHPDTGRRCWHLHHTKPEAAQCRVEMATRLDGTTKGWYLRGISEWRAIGMFSATGRQLMALLDELGIEAYMTVTDDRRALEDPYWVMFRSVPWDDSRFVGLRLRAGWSAPAKFHPPPSGATVRVDVKSGKTMAML